MPSLSPSCRLIDISVNTVREPNDFSSNSHVSKTAIWFDQISPRRRAFAAPPDERTAGSTRHGNSLANGGPRLAELLSSQKCQRPRETRCNSAGRRRSVRYELHPAWNEYPMEERCWCLACRSELTLETPAELCAAGEHRTTTSKREDIRTLHLSQPR